MKVRRRVLPELLVVVAFALACGGPPRATAQTGEVKGDALRPEIGKVLQAADELVKAGKFDDALAKLREADAVADRTPYEKFFIERMRGAAAAEAGDLRTTVSAFEAVVASGRLAPGDHLKAVEVLALSNFRLREYPKAATWAARYFKDGGTDAQMRILRVRSLYLNDEFANAASELREVIDADEKAGTAPALDRLLLLASCYIKLDDGAGYTFALEKLLTYHPKKEYWADAIHRVESRAGFPDRLVLDVLRLRHATGQLRGPAQYTAMAQLALTAGYPAEAKQVLEQGYASGTLGTGADADAQRRLRDTAAKQAAEDETLLAQNAKDANAAKDGTALVNVGFAMVTAGRFDEGLALMEQGIVKGRIRRPDDANLHLGIAYLAAGRKAKAIPVLQSVKGADGTADLARLWLIHAQRRSN